MKVLKLCWTLLFMIGFTLCTENVSARLQTYRISDWQNWVSPRTNKHPKALVDVNSRGEMRLIKVRQSINAASNAVSFSGGVKAGSNNAEARKVIDGNLTTWWSPSSQDQLKDWWIRVDLGRVVAATTIRLRFPKLEGVKPLEQFRVYVWDGKPTYGTINTPHYVRVGRMATPKTDPSPVEYPLYYSRLDTTSTSKSVEQRHSFRPVRYIYIRLDSPTPDQALAEIEVDTYGDNLALNAIARGGGIVAGKNIKSAEGLIDGQALIKTAAAGNPFSSQAWERAGAWFLLDLGAVFWVNRIILIEPTGRHAPPPMQGFRLYVSDGSAPPGGISVSKAELEQHPYKQFQLNEVADIRNWDIPLQYWFNITFPFQPVRYIFFHHAHGSGNIRTPQWKIEEMLVYGKGYAAQAELKSSIIDLERAKNTLSLLRDADLPPGTNIRVRSRAGNSLMQELHYYDQWGNEITKEQYESLIPYQKKKARIDTLAVPGADWDNWSMPYRWTSDGKAVEGFLSKSPSRYVRLKIELVSNSPDATPVLRSFTLSYDDPFVKEAIGEITPHSVTPDTIKQFNYRISATRSQLSTGFDRILLKAPFPIAVSEDYLRINGESVVGDSVTSRGDSLIVYFHPAVQSHRVVLQEGSIRQGKMVISVHNDTALINRGAYKDTLALYGKGVAVEGARVRMNSDRRVTVTGDAVKVTAGDTSFVSASLATVSASVEDSINVYFDPVTIRFKGRVLLDNSVVKAFIGHSASPGIWQRVIPDPKQRRATTVIVPAYSRDAERLIDRVSISPKVITPNGDGSNDSADIRFSVLKLIPQKAWVEIYDLRGRLVNKIEATEVNEPGFPSWKAVWSGLDSLDKVVSPGLYLCQIKVKANSGETTVIRTVEVVY